MRYSLSCRPHAKLKKTPRHPSGRVPCLPIGAVAWAMEGFSHTEFFSVDFGLRLLRWPKKGLGRSVAVNPRQHLEKNP